MATNPSTGETTASAIKPAPMATAQMSRGWGARPRTKPRTRIKDWSDRRRAARAPLSWRHDPACHGIEHAVGGLARDLRLRAKDQSVAKRRRQQRLDMVRSHEVMAVEGRKGAGRQHQKHLRAG